MTSVEREVSRVVQFNHVTNKCERSSSQPIESHRFIQVLHFTSGRWTQLDLVGWCWSLLHRCVEHPEGGGRTRNEGGSFLSGCAGSLSRILPLRLCQIQLLPDSRCSMNNNSESVAAAAVCSQPCPRRAQRPPMHRILKGKTQKSK